MRHEQQLIRECLDGKRTAQKALYEQFAPKMLGVCYRYARSADDAQDMLQESFIRVFQNLHQYKFEGSFEGWIRRVVVTTSLNFLSRNKHVDLQESLNDRELDALEQPEIFDRLEHLDLLSCIRKLPQGYATVINLHAIEGFEYKEISELLGITESSVRSQYARARAQLVRLLEKENAEKRHE